MAINNSSAYRVNVPTTGGTLIRRIAILQAITILWFINARECIYTNTIKVSCVMNIISKELIFVNILEFHNSEFKKAYRFDLVSMDYLQKSSYFMRMCVMMKQLGSTERICAISMFSSMNISSSESGDLEEYFLCRMIRGLRQGRNLNCQCPNLTPMIFI